MVVPGVLDSKLVKLAPQHCSTPFTTSTSRGSRTVLMLGQGGFISCAGKYGQTNIARLTFEM